MPSSFRVPALRQDTPSSALSRASQSKHKSFCESWSGLSVLGIGLWSLDNLARALLDLCLLLAQAIRLEALRTLDPTDHLAKRLA